MTLKTTLWSGLVLVPMLAMGCRQSPAPPASSTPGEEKTPDSAKYLLSEEPAGAKGVIEVREQAKNGEAVVVVGRVGGSREPCVRGRAAFTIVDTTYQSCDERGENCETPWDYCHASKEELARATVMVKIVVAEGKTLPNDAQESLGIRPLQTVVIRGKAKRDDDGNLTVLAQGIYIRPRPR